MRKRTIVSGICIILLALALTGCPQHRRIGEISGDPGRYYNREVAVTGRVTRSYGALGQGVYEIDDGTGRIWVFTEKYGVPSKDSYVGVAGKVIPGVTFGGRNYATVLRETDRRSHPRQ